MSYARSGIGTSLFLIAVGAILRYAVTAAVTGVALRTVGLILMLVGFVGLAISVAFLLLRPRERVVERKDYYE
jgi:uncharacterized protein DUF6458